MRQEVLRTAILAMLTREDVAKEATIEQWPEKYEWLKYETVWGNVL